MTKRVDEATKARARALYMQGWSLRDIAAEVLPDSSGGYVTVHRWATAFGWKDEKAELEAQAKAAAHDRYLDVVTEIKERHIRIAQKATQAVELALDGYFEKDAATGQVVGVKLNKWGLPAIPAVALVQLLSVATDLERKTTGMDQLQAEDQEQTATLTPVVDSDLAKRIGDYLAQQALEAPAGGTDFPVSGKVENEDDDARPDPV